MDEIARDEVYGKLKGIRERACRLQNLVEEDEHRAMLQTAVDVADRLGVWYVPDRWSRFDEPPLPEEDLG